MFAVAVNFGDFLSVKGSSQLDGSLTVEGCQRAWWTRLCLRFTVLLRLVARCQWLASLASIAIFRFKGRSLPTPISICCDRSVSLPTVDGVSNLSGSLSVLGSGTFQGAFRARAASSLEGTVTVSDDVDANSSMPVREFLKVGSRLPVIGDVLLGGALSVMSFAELNSSLSVASQAYFGNDLSI